MAQTLNLSVSGIYTSISDFQGLPPGALDAADNLESRYKNVLEPRRGFDLIANTLTADVYYKRTTNFFVNGIDLVVALTNDGNLVYNSGANPLPVLSGNVTNTEGLQNPDDLDAKCRFLTAGQNLYITALDGIRSFSSGSGSAVLRAGIPKALNLDAVTNGDSSGFFDNNIVVTTTGDIASSSALVTNIADITGIVEGLYVADSAGHIPAGTTISSITDKSTITIQTGNTTATNTTISNVTSITNIVAGVLVTGSQIPDGAVVVSTSGAGPYSVVINLAAFQSATGASLTFTAPIVITMSANSNASVTGTTLTFFKGAQVGYKILYGRVETDILGNTITRLGTPSVVAYAYNTSKTPTNATITATLPKNSAGEITFAQLYRTDPTAGIDISPLDQYNLVYERQLVPADFVARTISITDIVTQSIAATELPLYTGSDQEGARQANDPPPSTWDMCKFRDFALFGNITRPTSVEITMIAVGSPSGVQINDTVTVSGSFVGVTFSETYTGASSENAATRHFKVFSSGTASQNVTDTTTSLIRVINYDNSLPVHVIYVSTQNGLGGQMLFEADYANLDTFTISASGHTAAYDPTLTDIVSEINTINNGVAVSKSGELEAVPIFNLLSAGDTSSSVIRLIALRDYVVVIKSDGIYRIQGTSPDSLIVSPFDLTTKIISADTAVSLNSACWVFTNQGVVTIDDGGVTAKSIQIDDQLNELVGNFLDNIQANAFGIGYESDRKYILFIPDDDESLFSVKQYVFNYITSAWTTWSREFYSGFIHSHENKLYVSCADVLNTGISKERKTGSYQDYVDEAFDVTIVSVDGDDIVLASVDNIEAGDILYQSSSLFSPVLSVDTDTSTITVQDELSFTPGAAQILQAYECSVTWKQVFADNPAFVRQYPEGIALFKNSSFNEADLSFVTDFSQSTETVIVAGNGNGLWGLFPWGTIPWGGAILPSKIRFYIPQDKQLGSYLIPTMSIKQGYSHFLFQGLAIQNSPVSPEVGL